MNTIAFRIWDKEQNKFWHSGSTPSMLKSFFENTAVLNTRDEMPYQQYTGLSDKKGVWIYEGDIVKRKVYDEEEFFEVKFGEQNYNDIDPAFGLDYIGFSAELLEYDKELEIIGNIYSDSHLLNPEKKIKKIK